MMLVRPVQLTDLPAILQLAHDAGVGLTTLPPDERLLQIRIEESVRAFNAEIARPAGEAYLLVLEDLTTGAVVGTSGIIARVGGFEPFYSYELRTTLKSSKALAVHKEIRSLHLIANHAGPSEIGTLFLHRDHRRGGNGRLLSLARFMLMGGFPGRFDREVIAEMRGVSTPDGHSPFWENIGRHFFNMDFGEADHRSAADKSFIAELMPQHPVYIPMLSAEAQEVIGQVHSETRPALKLLEAEGFRFSDQVDIFDAGPLISAARDEIRSIREARVARVRAIVKSVPDETPWLISNERLNFRACMGPLTLVDDQKVGTVELPRDVALTLGVRLGEPVRFVPPRPT